MTVSDLMRTDVVTAGPDTTASDLGRDMRDEGVGSVVIVEDGRPTGIVTDRDLATGVVAESADPERRTARDLMTPDPVTVPATAGVFELCDEFGSSRVRRMPVVADDGTLAGIVTLDDLHVMLVDEQHDLARAVQASIPPY
ncbi:CBS domain-containing protein [Halobaculum litoreum]|uniref:CBS domain-containing protein n=1 Tax=Halobaculum litoreum TaxID=3031998 RepID=A0ABD5XYH8_9EURY